ncbi:hypothetical protein B0O99DRAFT_620341 [Bisporella sp. PMI_857]|nr:hypothetical protein B0O99DRAFT_620341 [Bisporella sp. PMI_857]
METRHFAGRHYEGQASGPVAFFNPTVRQNKLQLENTKVVSKEGNNEDSSTAGEHATQGGDRNRLPEEHLQRRWRARDNRKGRHALAVISPETSLKYDPPPSTSTLSATFRGILRMFTSYPVWDVSYLVAIVFTLGSVIWCINAFFVWLPLEDPSTEFGGEIENAGGITAFIGATIFEIGSVLLMVEAVNENRSDCFGWALEEVLEERGVVRVKKGDCVHHHQNRGNLVGKGQILKEKPREFLGHDKDRPVATSKSRTWTWFPSWHELRTHYIREIGFLACLSQMIGATIFWISGFTALPPIYNRLNTTPALNGAYWAPQVIGGTGFIISGTLFMLETQKKWYLPAWEVLGWHIGAWNLVGGIGFTLCGALGFASANSGAVYQGSLATFWGSWCFLIGSIIQWYESLDKHPVEVDKGKG